MTEAKVGRRGFALGMGAIGACLALGGPTYAASPKPKVLIKTNHGNILVEIEAQRAPITSTNFLRYVDVEGYDGGVFYRSVRDEGNPTHGDIVGRPNLKNHPFPPIDHEPTTKTGLRHVRGTISLGRFAPGTATSNFFICASTEAYLDAHPGEKGDNLGYAAFGQVLEGMPVVDKILSLPTGGATKFAEQRGQWLKPQVPIISMRRAG